MQIINPLHVCIPGKSLVPKKFDFMLLPSGLEVQANTPIFTCKNFTWGEATANLTRYPKSLWIENKIINTALRMEDVRKMFGNRPIKITSWYRDPTTNRRVNGSSKSRHLKGDGVDFIIPGINPLTVYKRLDSMHDKGGLGKYRSFTHIDFRGEKARWDLT